MFNVYSHFVLSVLLIFDDFQLNRRAPGRVEDSPENYRRKFRSQTSDLWGDAATVVRTVREEKESEKRGPAERRSEMGNVREERARRKKIQAREKVETLRSILFLICFVAPESRKVGSLKRW